MVNGTNEKNTIGGCMITLQQLLETTVTGQNKDGAVVKFSPDFRVAVQQVKDGGIHFLIHPDGHNGETLDFIVTGNELKPLNG